MRSIGESFLTRLRITFIDLAQCLQNVTAWLRKFRGDFRKLPSSMGKTVGQQDLRAVGEVGMLRDSASHI